MSGGVRCGYLVVAALAAAALTHAADERAHRRARAADPGRAAWGAVYDELYRGPLAGYAGAGQVLLNKEGGLILIGWTLAEGQPPLNYAPALYCDEVRRRGSDLRGR